MTRSGSHGWRAFTLIGIALWIGVTVLVTVLNDDASDPRPTLLTFAAGGAVFFGITFGVAFWQTRPRPDPELDALLAELTLEQAATRLRASLIGSTRRIARAYIVLGALTTVLGLSAIAQEALEQGSARTTLTAMIVVVIVWACAVPFVIRFANRASASILAPLGLEQRGAVIAGERYGRAIRIEITPAGSVTRLTSDAPVPAMSGDEILAYAGSGDTGTWSGVRVESKGGRIVIRRQGHEGPSWLWDVWLAERWDRSGLIQDPQR